MGVQVVIYWGVQTELHHWFGKRSRALNYCRNQKRDITNRWQAIVKATTMWNMIVGIKNCYCGYITLSGTKIDGKISIRYAQPPRLPMCESYTCYVAESYAEETVLGIDNPQNYQNSCWHKWRYHLLLPVGTITEITIFLLHSPNCALTDEIESINISLISPSLFPVLTLFTIPATQLPLNKRFKLRISRSHFTLKLLDTYSNSPIH